MTSRRKSSSQPKLSGPPAARPRPSAGAQRLRQQLAESERRREEAEQTLEAIRSGAVDAVVVSGPAGEQVYTLQGAERSYRLLVETVNAGALTLALDGLVLYANHQMATILGLPLERLLGSRLETFVPPEERVALEAVLLAALGGEAAGDITLLGAGRRIPVHVALRPLTEGTRRFLCAVVTDLTERKQAEAALQEANRTLEARVTERTADLRQAAEILEETNVRLEEANAGLSHEIAERQQVEGHLREALVEKESALAENQTLLREVHHRVKNNLQMLCDVMYLQMEAMPDRDQHQDLQDAYGRIFAIARLHEQLYLSMSSGRIWLGEYFTRLAGGFEEFFPRARIAVDADGGLALDVDRAIHVGLIVNELITNALKHAFPRGEAAEVRVVLRRVGFLLQLQVADRGRGLPADFDWDQGKTLGLRTVKLLARRLEGEIDIAREGGTTFTLSFPLTGAEPVEPAQT